MFVQTPFEANTVLVRSLLGNLPIRQTACLKTDCTPTMKSIEKLAEEAIRGDQTAFGKLVQLSMGTVTGVAYSILGDHQASEDVSQEVFIEAWKKLSDLRNPNHILAWLCTMTRHRAIDHVRQRNSTSKVAKTLPLNDLLTLRESYAPPEDSMTKEQELEMVWKLLESLPINYRETLVLYYRNDQSVDQVALATGQSSATVRQRLKRGRDMLRGEVISMISENIGKTAPTAAFSAAVLAALPASGLAAGAGVAASTSAAASGTITTTGTASTSAASTGLFGAAGFLGPAIGALGAAFGVWNGFRNCEYSSQRRWMIRQVALYLVALTLFFTSISVLTWASQNQRIPPNTIGLWFGALMIVFQTFNLAWIFYGIHRYKKLGQIAERQGEPRILRTVNQQMQTQESPNLQVTQSMSRQPLQWDAGGWFGGVAGCCAWMIPTGILGYSPASPSLSISCIISFCLITIAGVLLWFRRSDIRVITALYLLVGLTLIATTSIFAAIQFLSTSMQQSRISWNAWYWFLLLLFPLLFIRFRYMHASRSSTADADLVDIQTP